MAEEPKDDYKSVRENLPSNTNKKKTEEIPERAEVAKIISGEAIQVKKPLGRKIAETFTGDDIRSVGDFLLFEVAIPAAKNFIADAFSEGINRLLFGGTGGSSRRIRTASGKPPVGYNRMFKDDARSSGRSMSQKARATHDFSEIKLDNRAEAEDVIDKLTELVSKYGVASVSDLYDLVGVTGTFTDDKWGWDDLRSATVRIVRGGYLVSLPPPNPLD